MEYFPLNFPQTRVPQDPSVYRVHTAAAHPTPDVGGGGGSSCQDQAGSSRPADLQKALVAGSPLAWKVGGLQLMIELGREVKSWMFPFWYLLYPAHLKTIASKISLGPLTLL